MDVNAQILDIALRNLPSDSEGTHSMCAPSPWHNQHAVPRSLAWDGPCYSSTERGSDVAVFLNDHT